MVDKSGDQLGTCEALESFNAVVKQSQIRKEDSFATYMNIELLSLATKLHDTDKYPIQYQSSYQQVISTCYPRGRSL